MRKLFALFITLTTLFTLTSTVFAADDTATVYVTVANGTLALAHTPVTVTDVDGDGALTINDALTIAHNDHYEGGAEAGYGSAVGDYGLSMTKLWGVENGGSYGYYLNNASAMSLTDTVKDGDSVTAFVYTDLTAWSDTYSYFNVEEATATAGDTVTLTLLYAGYDANWAPIEAPVAGAVITVDGTPTEYVTAEDGTVTVTVTEGEHVYSASADTMTLVPPVCIITGEAADAPQTGDGAFALVLLLVASLGVALIRRRAYER